MPSSFTVKSLSSGLSKLYLQTLTSRYCIRLVNGPSSVFDAIRYDSWAYPPLPELPLAETEYPYTRESHPSVRAVEKTMPYTMLGYYPTEYVAYASWFFPGLLHNGDAPPAGSLRDSGKWKSADFFSAVSCSFWLMYIVADIVVQSERVHRITAILGKLRAGETPAEGGLVADLEAQLYNSKVLLGREVLSLLPAFAWSFEDVAANPRVPNAAINSLMWLESILDYVTKVDSRMPGGSFLRP